MSVVITTLVLQSEIKGGDYRSDQVVIVEGANVDSPLAFDESGDSNQTN